MSINEPLFDSIYKKGLSIINESLDQNIQMKEKKLRSAYAKLCEKEDHELQEFYSVVHELRLYQYIKNLGIGITATNDNGPGPDFLTDLGYVECVSITKGLEGTPERDELEKRLKQPMNRYETALLRLSSAIVDKAKKYYNYLEKERIDGTRPCIIAISTSIFSNEFHGSSNLELALQILYGIGYDTMQFDLTTNSFIEDNEVETHAYTEIEIKPPRNVSIRLNLFNDKDYEHISGVIVNNNAISEELKKDFCCLLLNPSARLPIDEKKLKRIKYFVLKSKDQQHLTYTWVNQTDNE